MTQVEKNSIRPEVDAVHGHGNLKGATVFPHNVGLGAFNDPDLMHRIGKATAEEMLATGIPWNFAPVVAVPQDISGTVFGTSTANIIQPYLLDQGDTLMDEASLRTFFLPPYQAAVDAGAMSVMASFSSWNGLKMHAHYPFGFGLEH